nr:CMF_HP1_G0048260.mRNA.1.CDS.1 [Saccharomyces cerevisiae]
MEKAAVRLGKLRRLWLLPVPWSIYIHDDGKFLLFRIEPKITSRASNNGNGLGVNLPAAHHKSLWVSLCIE